jgi:exodeoxyribonuclease V alpha subunit
MQDYGLNLQATTIHRLLETKPSETGGWKFGRDAFNRLRQRFVVCDEASMIDNWLMSCLLAARGPNTHILFVGDVNQLPPVGRGAPLRDMISAGLPYGELREIHRNAGSIVQVCAKIRDGLPWEPDLKLDVTQSSPANLKLLEARSGIFAQHRLVNAMQSAVGFCDPIWDVQAIVATNQKSPLSREALNPILQGLLNGDSKAVENTPFRIGDKVICLKNSTFGGHLVANGDIGKVLQAEPEKTTVEFYNPTRLVAVPRVQTQRKDWTGCDLSLAYAVTCHKYQGSEIPYAFVCLDDSPGARMVCSREWLYTAISRARIATLMVGRLSTAMQMCQRQAIHERKTFLKELIQEWH